MTVDIERKIRDMLDLAAQKYNTEAQEKIKAALEYAKAAHESINQRRSSLDQYIIHPVETAIELMDLRVDHITIQAGLLHDVVEDTPITLDDVKEEFGEEVAELVDGVTKLTGMHYQSKQEREAENLRKMTLAMAKDIRVILIKFADRLHNLRTLEYMDPIKQREKAKESLDIYAPLAHRLGIYRMKWKLEDESLKYIDPTGYKDLVERINEKREERENYIAKIKDILTSELNKRGINYEITGRPKHFYSIYKKMYMQHREFDQIFDLLAMRVLVDNEKECYEVLGLVHQLWRYISGRFKDYVAVPKPNRYQSLHTTVIGPDDKTFEIQIRTYKMHETAEFGVAAHWKYKEGRSDSNELDKKLAFLRPALEKQDDNALDFMDTMKLDVLFQNEVLVYTPKGDVKSLPEGSTPLDFAYAIHSDVGDHCSGALVNGRIVQLTYKLKTGDMVKVLTASNHHPSRDWQKIVKTHQAKSKIRQWFKRERKDENTEEGRTMLEKAIRQHGFFSRDLLKTEWLELIQKKQGFHDIDDIYAGIGYGGMTVDYVLSRLMEEFRKEQREKQRTILPEMTGKDITPSSDDKGVHVDGIGKVAVRFSRCCYPLPGDDIIGYITRGRGVSVHRRACKNLQSGISEEYRLIDVHWGNTQGLAYTTQLRLIARNRDKLAADVTGILSDMRVPVQSMLAKATRKGKAIIEITFKIRTTEYLNEIIRKFKRIYSVEEVLRIN